jgi:Lrp/AsnC family transcriptional regulator, regulator for asnA, asnC and gidA
MVERLVRHGSAPFGTVTLDVLDRHIIQLLRYDGRRSYADIARLVKVSEPTVRKRVDRLVQTGAIYVVARVNPAAIGFAIDAMVGIRVKRGSVQHVGTRLAAMDNVAYVAYMTGGFDIFIEVFLPDTEGLFRFLTEDLARIDGISSIDTWHVLRTEKFFYSWEGEDLGLQPSSRPLASHKEEVRQGSMPHGTVRLDDLDRRIMKLLRHDGRLAFAEIARTVGVSEPTVRKRVDRLVHAGAIAIMARVNPAPIGFPIDAYVGIRVARGQVTNVGRKLAEMDNIAYLGYVSGSFDIMIEAFLPDTQGLFKFLNEDLEAVAGISQTETWHALRVEKFFYEWEGEEMSLPSEQPASGPRAGDPRPAGTHT